MKQGGQLRAATARRRPAWHGTVGVLVFVTGVGASGCAPRRLYDWGTYEESLQATYVAHDDAQAWTDMQATINHLQQTNGRVPPGVYAEYGFALYKQGNRTAAVEYFQREAQVFPEAKPLMDRLIAKMQKQDGRAATAPAGEPEEAKDGAPE